MHARVPKGNFGSTRMQMYDEAVLIEALIGCIGKAPFVFRNFDNPVHLRWEASQEENPDLSRAIFLQFTHENSAMWLALREMNCGTRTAAVAINDVTNTTVLTIEFSPPREENPEL